MKCTQMKTIFDTMIDGTMTTQQRKQLEEHIQTCTECRHEAQMQGMMETVLSECYTLGEPSDEITQSILNRISAVSPAPANDSRWAMGTFTKIAAGFLLLIALGVGFSAGRWNSVAPSINVKPTAFRIQSVEGTILVRHPGATAWLLLTGDCAVYVGDEWVSAPNAKATFTLDAKSTLMLSENSMLVLKTAGETTEWYLATGCLDAALESPHGPFFVTTPHGRAEALGTEFTVHVQ